MTHIIPTKRNNIIVRALLRKAISKQYTADNIWLLRKLSCSACATPNNTAIYALDYWKSIVECQLNVHFRVQDAPIPYLSAPLENEQVHNILKYHARKLKELIRRRFSYD